MMMIQQDRSSKRGHDRFQEAGVARKIPTSRPLVVGNHPR